LRSVTFTPVNSYHPTYSDQSYGWFGHATQVRGLSLDEVYAAIVDHEQRPLIVTFLDPPARHEHLWVQHQGENEGEWERSLSPEVVSVLVSEPAADVEDDGHRSVREYLAGKGMEACTGGVCRALSEHGTEPSQWLSTLTGMAAATQRDLLEAVRAQYARESPLRSLGKKRLTKKQLMYVTRP